MPAHNAHSALTLAMMAVVACGGAQPTRRPAHAALSTRPAAPSVEAVVDGWLTCIDCTDGELDSVLAAGDVAVTLLALRADSGLAPGMYAMVKARALRVRLRALGDSMAPGTRLRAQAEEKADREAADVALVARARAYHALGQMATPRATAALDLAARDLGRLPPLLRRAVRTARDSSHR